MALGSSVHGGVMAAICQSPLLDGKVLDIKITSIGKNSTRVYGPAVPSILDVGYVQWLTTDG